jgi:hypothetical protein
MKKELEYPCAVRTPQSAPFFNFALAQKALSIKSDNRVFKLFPVFWPEKSFGPERKTKMHRI